MPEDSNKTFIRQLLTTEDQWKNGMSETFRFGKNTYTINRERLNPPSKRYRLESNGDDRTYTHMADMLLDIVNESTDGAKYESIEEYLNK